MQTLEIGIQKIRCLPTDQLNQVVQFIEFLEFKADNSNETSTEEVIERMIQGLREASNSQTLHLSQIWDLNVPSSNPPHIQVLLTPRFNQNLKKLAKRYRSIC